jgi:hypothetical protein
MRKTDCKNSQINSGRKTPMPKLRIQLLIDKAERII